jgi:protein O-GlcNAc transferase
VLWFSDANEVAKEKLQAAARSREVDEGRLVFAPKLDAPEEHLARHRLADLFLDTLPYNAHATASDALFAGLPVVTTPGNSFAGKVGASLLAAVGLSDLDTPDLAAYEALALQLAREPEKLADCKERLERGRLTAPLFATEAYVRHLEEACASMHARWRSGTPPQSFAVPRE